MSTPAEKRIQGNMKRDFKTLTAQEALHVAIFIEERNAELYRQFAELFADFKDSESLEIAQVFWEMSQEERGHGSRLQEKYFERYGTQACVVTDEEISEVIEMPRLDTSNIFSVSRAHATLSPRRSALEVALEAEQMALRYYRRLLEVTREETLHAIYSELANYEADHTTFIQQKLAAASRAVEGGEIV